MRRRRIAKEARQKNAFALFCERERPFLSQEREKGGLVPEFLREPPERGWVDTLPLRSGKNSSFEIEARQHAEGLQV